MHSLYDAAFLIGTLLGFFLHPDLQKGVVALSMRRATERLSLLLPFFGTIRFSVYQARWLIGALLFILSIIGFYYYHLSSFHPETLLASDYYPKVRFISPLLIDIILSISLGFFFRGLYDYLAMDGDRSINPYAFAAKSAPVIALIVIGFFSDDVRSSIKDTQSIETPYFSLQFTPTTTTDAKVYFESSPRPTLTDFQRGMIGLLAAMRAPFTDLEKLYAFCFPSEEKPRIICNLPDARAPHLSRFVESTNLTYYNKQLSNPLIARLIFPRTSKSDVLAGNIYDSTLDYFANFQALSSCLRIFNKRYPNGLPILEEISEYAADYAVSLIQRKDNLENHMVINLHQFEKVIGRLIDGGSGEEIVDGRKYTCELSGTQRASIIASMKFRERQRTYLARHFEREERGAILPYRAIFVANLLLMSGHSAEAATHLEREYSRYLAHIERASASTNTEIGFADFLFRLHFLTHIDNMHEINAKKQRTIDLRNRWIESLSRVRALIREWLQHNTTIGALSLENVLANCRDRSARFFEGNRGRSAEPVEWNSFSQKEPYELEWYLAMYREPMFDKIFLEEDSVFGETQKKEYMLNKGNFEEPNIPSEENYMTTLLKYYISKNMDYLSAAVSVGGSIAINDLEEAIEHIRIATKRPELIEGCFDEQVNLKRAKFAFAAAEAYAFFAQELQEKEVLIETLDNSVSAARASQRNVCNSEAALRVVLAVLRNPKSNDEAMRLRERAREMLRQIGPGTCEGEERVDDLRSIIEYKARAAK